MFVLFLSLGNQVFAAEPDSRGTASFFYDTCIVDRAKWGSSSDVCERMTGQWCQSKACKPADCLNYSECQERPLDDVNTCSPGMILQGGKCVRRGGGPTLCGNVALNRNQQCCNGVVADAGSRCPGGHACPTGQKMQANGECIAVQPADDDKAGSKDPAADLQTCQSLAQQASKCCNNPLSCLSQSEQDQISNQDTTNQALLMQAKAGGDASMRRYCEQLKTQGASNGQANSRLGQVCYQSYSSCQSQCQELSSINQSVDSLKAQSMAQAARTCSSYSQKLSQLGSQALSSTQSSQASAQCQQLSQAGTQSLGDMGMGGDDGGSDGFSKSTVDAIQEQNCQTHPDSESCKALRAQSLNNGVGSFVDASKNSKPNFNVNDGRVEAQIPFADPNQAQNQGATVTPVPNNTGGGLPQNQAANQPRAGTNRPSPGSPGFNTDIMRGDRSGGGYSAPYVDNSAAETPDGAGVKRKIAAENDPAYLKSFLPGGSRDPKFNWRPDKPIDPMALQRQQLGIYGPEVNIFEKVSQAYIRVCKEGRLYDCIDHIATSEQCTAEHNRIKELVEGRTKPAVATLPAASPGVQAITKPAVVTQPSVKSRMPASVLPNK